MNCITCGYDCTGLDGVRCPECGQWPMLARPRRAGAGTLLLMGLGATFVVYLYMTGSFAFSLSRQSGLLHIVGVFFCGAVTWAAYVAMRRIERYRRKVEQLPFSRLALLTLAGWSPLWLLICGIYVAGAIFNF